MFVDTIRTLPVLVEVIERAAELIKLFLRDALRISGEDLVLDFVDGAVDGSEQLLPANSEGLHGVLSVPAHFTIVLHIATITEAYNIAL